MPNSVAQVHISRPLTNVVVEYKPPSLAWDQILIPRKVEKETDFWTVMDKGLFDVVDDTRADGAPSRLTQAGWKFEQYACTEHALHEIITKRQRDNVDSQIDLESSAAERVKQRVHNNIEQAVFGASGILRTTTNNVYSNNEDWSTLSSASPRSSFELAINAIEVASGVSPNVCVMSPLVARHIMRTAEYQAERRYVMDMQDLGGVTLPNEFYGLRAVYVGSLLNTSSGTPIAEGQATSLERVMGTDVWIGYVNPDGVGYKTLTYGVTLFTEEYASMWYDQDLRSDKIEYGYIFAQKVVAKECGALLQTVTA